jgi:hypothetical protein
LCAFASSAVAQTGTLEKRTVPPLVLGVLDPAE